MIHELGLKLKCLDRGDLGLTFKSQTSHETRKDGRYHKAFQLLGGILTWSTEEISDIDEFVKNLSNNQRLARRAGSEIDAAINDPRWKAVKGVSSRL